MSRFFKPKKAHSARNNDAFTHCGISLISPNTLHQKYSGSLKHFMFSLIFISSTRFQENDPYINIGGRKATGSSHAKKRPQILDLQQSGFNSQQTISQHTKNEQSCLCPHAYVRNRTGRQPFKQLDPVHRQQHGSPDQNTG